MGFYKPHEAVAMGASIGHPVILHPPDEVLPPQQLEQRRQERQQRLDHYMKSDNIWPLVRFLNGLLLICVPLPFEAVNANGDIEATRDQVGKLDVFLHNFCDVH